MPVTTAELNYARSFIGTTEEEDVFNERFDRLEADYDDRRVQLNAAIEESLRAQLQSMMLDQPSSASVGSVSFSMGANIQELARALKDFKETLGSKTLTTARLVRPRER
jgi:hypothetical protein